MRKIFNAITIIIIVAFFSGWFLANSQGALSNNKKNRTFRVISKNIHKCRKRFYGYKSLIIKDLSQPYYSYSLNPQKKIPAASIIKLLILSAALEANKNGKLSLEDNIIIRKRDITGGSGYIKTLKPPANFKIKELLEFMITRSDNTATNKIIDLLGYDYINKVGQSLGLANTCLVRKMMDFSLRRRGVNNYTTAQDMTIILEKMYRGELVDRESSKFMLDLFKKQEINDRIPKYLPKDTVIAHKTGLEKGVVHDVGIVFAPKGDYIICVLTQKVRDYQVAKDYIAEVSRITYNSYK